MALEVYDEASNTFTSVPTHAVMIATATDDRQMSAVYTEYISKMRQKVSQSSRQLDVLGPAKVDPDELVRLQSSTTENNLGDTIVLEWVTNFTWRIETMCLSEKLASCVLLAPLIRWQISPTLEHYRAIPDCMKPTPVQTMVPHPAWIDYVPWPEVREFFIKCPDVVGDSDIPALFARCMHINWASNNMLHVSPATDTLVLNEEFERFTRDLNNWSLERSAAAQFPQISNMAWINERQERERAGTEAQALGDAMEGDPDLTLTAHATFDE